MFCFTPAIKANVQHPQLSSHVLHECQRIVNHSTTDVIPEVIVTGKIAVIPVHEQFFPQCIELFTCPECLLVDVAFVVTVKIHLRINRCDLAHIKSPTAYVNENLTLRSLLFFSTTSLPQCGSLSSSSALRLAFSVLL